MALRILQVDAADTFYSLRDRLLRGGRERAVLLLPERANPVGAIDLVLLRRLADRERLEVGLVTADRALSRQARALGLPTFANLTLAEYYRPGWWRGGRRRERVGLPPDDERRSHAVVLEDEEAAARRGRLLLLLVLVQAALLLSLIALLAIYAFPQARVTLRATDLPAQTIFTLSADPITTDQSAISQSPNLLPKEATVDWEAIGVTTEDPEVDRERTRAQAMQGISAAAPNLLDATLEPGELLLPGSAELEVVAESMSETAAGRKLALTVRVSGLAVAAADLNAHAYSRLAAALPAGYAPDAATLEIHMQPAAEGQTGEFQVVGTATGRVDIDPEEEARAIRGMRLGDAARYLSLTLPLSEPPTFDVSPGWWLDWFGRMPLRAGQIQVEVNP